MADPQLRWPDNVAGSLYVDESCIDCDLCRTTAPNNFDRSTAGHSFVSRQPADAREEAACEQALAGCPVEAIGQDAPVAAPPARS